ncbi:MAG: thioredoxin domain-containing protein [Nitrospiraceae bacterium]
MLLVLTPMFVMSLAMPAEAGEALADVNDVAISNGEVEKALGAPLAKLQEQMYAMKRRMLETLINERLLANEAAKRGMSATALLDAEVTAKVGLVTEQEIDTIYHTHTTMLQGDEATVRQQIRAQLQLQKLAAQQEAFLKTLRSQAVVKVHLQPPPVFRATINADEAPFKGSATAPVTIVKFEDFHCPFCRRAQAVFTELLAKYGDKVKLAHRDFPLDQVHPDTRKAHEAARCAHEQGKFWAYHDVIYFNAPRAGPENLKAYAQEVGLDVAAFEQCLSSGTYQASVQKDVEEGTRLGVSGTPAFFINGRPLSGVHPVESFVQLIDDELARVQHGAEGSESGSTILTP